MAAILTKMLLCVCILQLNWISPILRWEDFFLSKDRRRNLTNFSDKRRYHMMVFWVLFLSITFVSVLNGRSVVLSIPGLLNQLLSEEIPRVSVSAGLSALSMWCQWSVVVDSRISSVRLPTWMGNLLQELSHWRTVVLSVHMKISVTLKIRSFKISSFKRIARRAAWCSNFVIESVFIGATGALPKTKATSVWCELASRARRKATAQQKSCELSPNMWSSIRSKVSVKWLRGFVREPNKWRPECHSRSCF